MGTMRCGYSNWPERFNGQLVELGEAEGMTEVLVMVANVELPGTEVMTELDATVEAVLGASLPEGPTLAEETELMLGAGNGPGTGVWVDPAPPLPELALLPADVDALLITELKDAETALAADVEAAVAELDEADEIAGHWRLYSGVVVKLDPTIPKLGLGVVGAASCNVYHQVFTLPNSEQPT